MGLKFRNLNDQIIRVGLGRHTLKLDTVAVIPNDNWEAIIPGIFGKVNGTDKDNDMMKVIITAPEPGFGFGDPDVDGKANIFISNIDVDNMALECQRLGKIDVATPQAFLTYMLNDGVITLYKYRTVGIEKATGAPKLYDHWGVTRPDSAVDDNIHSIEEYLKQVVKTNEEEEDL